MALKIETYFDDSNVIKSLEERIEGYVYSYDFDVVTDDDVQKMNNNNTASDI